MNKILIIICLLTLGSFAIDTTPSLYAQSEDDYWSNQQGKKKKKRKKSTEEKGVLQNPSGFDMYGEEPTPVTEEDLILEKPKKQRKARKKKSKTATAKKENPSSINVDLGILYNITIDTVVVKEKRTKIDFKTKEDIKYFYNQALLKVRSKDFNAAITYLDKSIKDDPYNKELLQLRGNAYVEVGKHKKAVKDFKKALKIGGDDAVLYYNLASTLLKLDEMDKAIRAFTNAIALKDNYLLALQGRASTYTMEGYYQEALADYSQVLEINPFFVPAFKGRGIVKSLLGRYDDAINDFSYVIELQPTDGMAYYYRGLAYVSNSQNYKGCSDFDKAYQLKIPHAYHEIVELCR